MRYLLILLLIIQGTIVSLPAWAQNVHVTDLLGRRMAIPKDPVRVVSLAPNITEIVYALGQSHRLVGATTYSDYPAEADMLPKVGSYVHLDLERIVFLAPDLCLAIKDGNPIAAISRLESIGIPVYAVDPRDLESVMDTLSRIGRLLQADKQAKQLVQGMRRRIQAVESLVAKTDHRPGLFFQIGISPIVSVGTNTFIHELIVQAGARNLAEGDIPYPRFSKEQVLGMSPDVIIVTSMARKAVFEKIRQDWYQWTNLPAVKNDRIYFKDSGLFDRPSPRLVDALEILVRLIHPEMFKEPS
ncbi:MAG: cobalamin-binding protein [Deltaproteobacteria bacterium]|nr:MAG: cobalamin-binding protein [Deltaproteobacteria bacterium]HHE74392.1 cobalamin-binding protein [Desulfobacteraceae bacterium]